ncbi:Putative DNA-binding protein [Mycobacteroides abscessus subsp. massiliense]|uniref:helix-turn-helix domain-containing protein n=1 Tax=Mycobacteroides abscessus TaxID=36809 RepID=UPI0009A592E0|nr:helix-turn-helix transcriptional regulator [Mycobacteroides abscessus]SLH95750.1 Putative DNA-binding protein [Mycobacteroides abscessus subsp. massiliense]SLI84246.1 Putative DNA-binding protein [Mycobacteroides abscessus subsp. massiliense]
MSKISMAELAGRHAVTVGQRIKVLRGGRTGQWLADRTLALGFGVARTTISELENKKRSFVTTGELSALAAALSVPPIALLFPPPYVADGGEGGDPALGIAATNIAALQWFVGDHVPEVVGSIGREAGIEVEWLAYKNATSEIREARTRNGLMAKREQLQAMIKSLVGAGASEAQISAAFAELDEVSQEIGRNGG